VAALIRAGGGNAAGVPQQVLPTFPALIVQGLARVPYGDIDRSRLVHAEQSVELLREIPPDGSGRYSQGRAVIDGVAR
jgi:hypothetical protein